MGIFFINACEKVAFRGPGESSNLAEYVTGNRFIKLTYSPAGDVNTITLSRDEYAVGGEATYVIRYGERMRISELAGDNGVRIKPRYKDRKLSHALVFINNELAYEVSYDYIGEKLANMVLKMADNNRMTTIMKIATYYDEEENPATVDTLITNPVTGQMHSRGFVIREFDDQINPLSEISDLMLLLMQPVSANNVTRENYYNSKIEEQRAIETNYTYNASQLPVSATFTESSPDKGKVYRQVKFSYQ